MAEREKRSLSVYVFTIVLALLIMVCGTLVYHLFTNSSLPKRIEYFDRQREALYSQERYQHLGGRNELSEKEGRISSRLVIEKISDRNDYVKKMLSKLNTTFDDAFSNDIIESVEKRPLFQYIQRMPKGAALHVKDFTMGSVQSLLSLTYINSLWICVKSQGSAGTWAHELHYFRFSIEKPENGSNSKCAWKLLSDWRAENGTMVDQILRQHFSYRNGELSPSLRQFKRLIYGLITYEPVWRMYVEMALEEFREDGVQYAEISSSLPELYNLYRSNLTYLDTARYTHDAIRAVTARNSDFVGAKLMYEPLYDQSDRSYTKFFQRAREVKREFPDIFAGINLASNLQFKHHLYFLSRKLIAIKNEFEYFYHDEALSDNMNDAAGDENLIDSLLLGCKRLPYHSAFVRHPEVLRLVRRMNVAVEIGPSTLAKLHSPTLPFGAIAKLNDHASAYLFSAGYPMVLSSEYRNFWRAKPLTHELYLAFVGISSNAATLGMLKELAINSIQFSSANCTIKREVHAVWARKWNEWIDENLEN